MPRPGEPRHNQKLLRLDGVVFRLLAVELRLPDLIGCGPDSGSRPSLLARRGLRGRLLLAEVMERREGLRLTEGRSFSLAEPAIDAGEQPLGAEKRGREVEAILEWPHRLFELLLAGQCRPQQKMPRRIAELEADALDCRVGSLLGPAGMEKAAGEHQKRPGIVRVGGEGGAGSCLGGAEAP
jgi:hypothetical protein